MIDRFNVIKDELIASFKLKEPDGYEDILLQTLKLMYPKIKENEPDWNRITVVVSGCSSVRGEMLFVVPDYGPGPYMWNCTSMPFCNCAKCDMFMCAQSKIGPEASAKNMAKIAEQLIAGMTFVGSDTSMLTIDNDVSGGIRPGELVMFQGGTKDERK